MANDPLLTIVVPFFNSANTLERTLRSLQLIDRCDRDRVQIICIDDGSTDRSAFIAAQCRVEAPEFLWEVARQENRGVSSARNHAIHLAAGRWILFLDADDELTMNPLTCLLATKDATTAVTFPVLRRFGRTNREKLFRAPKLSGKTFGDILSSKVPLHICAVIFKKRLIGTPFTETLPYLEDWKFWWDNQAVFSNTESAKSRYPLAIVHVHDRNRTSDFKATGVAREFLAQQILREEQLSRKQRNNWTIQRRIGLLLQGKSMSPLSGLRFPCSCSLSAKFYIYWLFKGRISVVHPYRRGGNDF